MNFFNALALLAVSSAPAAAADPAAVAGQWSWNSSGMVQLDAGGTCSSHGSLQCSSWKVGDGASPDDVIIFWNNNTTYDRMKLSADGTTLTGGRLNTGATNIRANRWSPEGSWTWKAGTDAEKTLTFRADGTCSLSGSSAQCNWKVGDSVSPFHLIVHWDNFRRYDRLTVGPDGETLTGHPNNRESWVITASRG